MIQHLKIRLTIIFSLLTGLILFLAVAFALRLNIRDYKQESLLRFQSEMESLESYFRSVSVIKDSYLRDVETNNNCIIHVMDNDSPFYFHGSDILTNEREGLIRFVLQEGEAALSAPGFQYADESKNQQIFDFTPNGSSDIAPTRKFRCGISRFTIGENQEITLYIIKDLKENNHHIRTMYFNYGLLSLSGVVLLTFVTFIMVSLALRPAKETLKQQQEFIASASHELRSPLTVIRTNLELLKDEPSRHLIDISLKETERMKHLTDDLLTLTNLDAKEKKVPLSDTCVDSLLMETYDTFYGICKKKNHPLTISLPQDELPHIESSEEVLKQLLGIFIQNAISHTPEGTEIEIKGREENNALFLSVTDHGKGISDAMKNKVFLRFYQMDESRTDKSHYGLGLSIAKELSDALHCKLKLSDTAGGGATFTLKFGPESFIKKHLKK